MKMNPSNTKNSEFAGFSSDEIGKAFESLDKEDIIREVHTMMADMPKKSIESAIKKEGSKEQLIKNLIPLATKKLVMKRLLVAGAAGVTVASAAAIADAAASTDSQDLGLADHLTSTAAENSDSLGDLAADAAKAVFELVTEFFK